MHKLVLVDGDIIINKASFAAETRWYDVVGEGMVETFKYKKDADKFAAENPGTGVHKRKDVLPLPVVTVMCDRLLEGIARNLECSNLKVIVGPASGTKIFRHEVYPNYKANRSGIDRPVHLKDARQHLIDKHNAVVANDMETDDLVGIIQCEEEGTVIASIDKDLLQIPGYHYNIDTREVSLSTDPGSITVSKRGKSLVLKGYGFKWFAAQMLLGDKVDNIPKPVKGMGPKKVGELFEGKDTPQAMWEVVEKVYKESDLDIDINATLLWIKRHPFNTWKEVL